jgi:bifunctional UDP-N-acetylglucosamine pyrophosphorylase / glucosamine-1-phosphate N-acetyltransferase
MAQDLDLAVVILAAGLGTRMKSKLAKVLHQAGGRSLIEHVATTASKLASPERIFVVVGHQADAVRKVVNAAPGLERVGFIHQSEQLGTGHAVMIGREQLTGIAENLLVLYGDGPLLGEATLRGLVGAHRENQAAVTLLTTNLDDPTGYGRIIRDADGKLVEIVEQKACTPQQAAITEINPGIYVFRTRSLFEHIGELTTDNPAKEYYLTDMAAVLRRAGERVETRAVADAHEVLGINTRVELAAMDREFRDRKAQSLMLSGVTIYRPETCVIDSTVEIGPDTVIGPSVALYGNTRIGENCVIRPFCTIRDTVIADGVMVHESCWMEKARVDRGASVGPYSRLRPGADVGEDAHVGNFVELKKARLGRGSKASHLAYLGDATVGDNVNIGAGVITCNYDGVNKNQTIIEDGSFVGTNSSLVAPVKVGKGAYVAAGSVITQEVPAGSLALGRARQEVKEGWVEKKKAKRC